MLPHPVQTKLCSYCGNYSILVRQKSPESQIIDRRYIEMKHIEGGGGGGKSNYDEF